MPTFAAMRRRGRARTRRRTTMRTHRADRVLGAALLAAALFLGSSGAAVMAADGPTLTGHDGSFERVKKSGVLRFGTSNDEPYTFLDPKTKKVEGIDADMTAYVMEKLGIPKREMVQDKFAGLIPGLLSKRFDI